MRIKLTNLNNWARLEISFVIFFFFIFPYSTFPPEGSQDRNGEAALIYAVRIALAASALHVINSPAEDYNRA